MKIATLIIIVTLLIGKAHAGNDGMMVCKPECLNGNKVYQCVDENGHNVRQDAYNSDNTPVKCAKEVIPREASSE